MASRSLSSVASAPRRVPGTTGARSARCRRRPERPSSAPRPHTSRTSRDRCRDGRSRARRQIPHVRLPEPAIPMAGSSCRSRPEPTRVSTSRPDHSPGARRVAGAPRGRVPASERASSSSSDSRDEFLPLCGQCAPVTAGERRNQAQGRGPRSDTRPAAETKCEPSDTSPARGNRHARN